MYYLASLEVSSPNMFSWIKIKISLGPHSFQRLQEKISLTAFSTFWKLPAFLDSWSPSLQKSHRSDPYSAVTPPYPARPFPPSVFIYKNTHGHVGFLYTIQNNNISKILHVITLRQGYLFWGGEGALFCLPQRREHSSIFFSLKDLI